MNTGPMGQWHEARTPTPPIERRTYTVAEAAEMLGVSPSTLRRAGQAGTSPVPMVKVNERWVVPRAPLDRLLAGEVGPETRGGD